MPGTEYTRNQILTQNTNDFPNNNAGLITPAILRDYNTNVANSVLFLNETGSHATSASYALSASYANNASTSDTSTSASYALTASYALNAAAAVNTGSLLLTASAATNVITFTKGDSSTFSITVDTGSATTVNTGSLMVTGSVVNNTLTFTKGDNTTFSLTVNTGSAASVNTGSLLVTASVSNDIITFTKGNNTTFDITVNNVKNSITSSVVSIGGDYTNTDRKIVFVGATGASIGEQLLINSSTPDLTYNPTTNVINATASFANQAVSSSYAVTASYALNGGGGTTNTGSLLVTASAALNVITFTKGDSTTFDVTVDTGSGAGVNTGSLLANASATNATITFTRGDSTTFGVTVNNVTTAATASTLSGLPSNAFARIGANNNFTASVGITLTSGSRTAGFYQTDTLYLVRGNLPEQGTREFGMTNRLGNIVPGFPTTSAGLYISTGSGASTYKAALEIPNGLAWGSINLKYRTQVTGGLDSTNGGFTGSLLGTASYALSSPGGTIDTGSFATTGSNIFTGGQVIQGLTLGTGGGALYYNTVFGSGSLALNTTAEHNTALGYRTLEKLSSGTAEGNTAVGSEALRDVTSSIYNTGVGFQAGKSITTGGSNVLVGSQAGSNITTGNGNTIIGANTNPSSATTNDTLIIAVGGNFPSTTGSRIIEGTIADGLQIRTGLNITGSVLATGSFISINGLKGADLGAPSADIWTVSNQYPDYGIFFVEGLANDFYEFRAAGTPTVQIDPDNGRVIASQFTGSLNGTATSASYITPLNQQVVFSGSVRGEVNALSIVSNTASLDCSVDNFFTLQLVQGTNTYINPTNINNGQTINILVNTTGSATVSFPTTVKQISGNSYTPTSTTGKDVLTLISFNDSNLYLVNVKNLV